MEDYYQLLGIPMDSDERAIKKAYHRLARELHPDKAETPEKAREAEHKFSLVSTAYNLLKDPTQRAEYDRKLNSKAGKGGGGSSASSKPSANSGPSVASRPPSGAPPSSAPRPSGASSSPGVNHAAVEAQRQAIAQKAYVKGVQLMKDRNYAKAAEFFEAAINNNEKEASYYARLAMALVEAKKSATRAVEAAQKAIDLDKYNLDYKFVLAQIYEAIGSKTNAIKIYEEILKWDPESQVAQQMIRQLNKKENAFTKAVEKVVPGSLLSGLKGRFGKK